jgi:hypothetical protein
MGWSREGDPAENQLGFTPLSQSQRRTHDRSRLVYGLIGMAEETCRSENGMTNCGPERRGRIGSKADRLVDQRDKSGCLRSYHWTKWRSCDLNESYDYVAAPRHSLLEKASFSAVRTSRPSGDGPVVLCPCPPCNCRLVRPSNGVSP